MNRITEKVLLLRLKSNDRKAAEKLIDVHYQQVYAFLFGLCKNKEIAQDLTQDTFIKAWQAVENFNGHSRFSTWLLKISYNKFLDYQRQQKKRNTSIDTDNADFILIDSSVIIDDHLEQNDLNQRIMDFIKQLSPKLRTIIILHYQQQLSIREIAGFLEIAKGTVKSRLNAALKELRNHVKNLEL